MKNLRNICFAGYLQYRNLPGAIKTGCQLSPLQTSKYCYYHAPRKSKKIYCDPEKDAGNPMASSTSEDTEEGVVKCIVGKKTTRSNMYYQVISNHFAARPCHRHYILGLITGIPK